MVLVDMSDLQIVHLLVARTHGDPMVNRVASRYLRAMEHANEKARSEYLKDHPNADAKNHSVADGKGSKPSTGQARGVSQALSKAISDGGKPKNQHEFSESLKAIDRMSGKLEKEIEGALDKMPEKDAAEVSERLMALRGEVEKAGELLPDGAPSRHQGMKLDKVEKSMDKIQGEYSAVMKVLKKYL